MKNTEKNFKEIQTILKETGFIFQGSEIYGGLANTWDYGPLGVLLTQNLKKLWWREFITKERNNHGLDSKILMNPEVWVASGHVGNFSDPLIENKVNGKRYRADHIIEEFDNSINAEAMTNKEMEEFINKNITKYDGTKTDWTEIREFHLMFETSQGVLVGNKSKIFLRPETAQGIFVNFKNVQRSMRSKLPLGIGQIGKSFRNEVTPGNYTFRTREFEQMELEVFVKPGEDDDMYKYYINKSEKFIELLGIKKESIKFREHDKDELAHYSKGTTDIEFLFPFGWGELLGISNRTDFDLKAHMKHSKTNLEYRDPITNDTYIPYIIEPSMGMDRVALAVLIDAIEFEEDRTLLKIAKELAPYKVAVLPLSKKHHSEIAQKVFEKLLDMGIDATFDEAGSIGKRYRRQDLIGTPICITIIDETKDEDKITIRFRDSMKQENILFKDIKDYI